MRGSSPQHDEGPPKPTPAPLAREIGRTRYVVMLAVIAVVLVAVTLFLLGTYLAVVSLWHASQSVFQGELSANALTVEFLEIVSVMLKAVFFYIIGAGLYSLFIAPLNLTAALGVETLNDLETKTISVIIVIMAVTFLEHFIRWEQPTETLVFGIAFALVVAALVFFQQYSHRAREETKPTLQARARHELFEEDREKAHVDADEA